MEWGSNRGLPCAHRRRSVRATGLDAFWQELEIEQGVKTRDQAADRAQRQAVAPSTDVKPERRDRHDHGQRKLEGAFQEHDHVWLRLITECNRADRSERHRKFYYRPRYENCPGITLGAPRENGGQVLDSSKRMNDYSIVPLTD